MIERIAEHRTENDDQPDQGVEQAVDRPLQRGPGVPKRTRLSGHPRGEATLADRGHAVRAGAFHDERAGKHLLPGYTSDGLGLAGQDGLIEAKVGGRQDRAVGDHLIAGLNDHHVVDHELLEWERTGLTVPPHGRGWGDQ